MCGIVGFLGYKNQKVSGNLFASSVDTMKHRGPDGKGIEIFEGEPFVALGHRRLAIIDISKVGRQPMCNEDNSIWLIFNGEIYNYKNLREQLIEKGHRFKSHTDSEVIIHGYEEWGIDCLYKFNGMFSFAIWDSTKKELFVARDRLGIKPLYYYYQNDKFIFASEIKAILKFVSPILNHEALTDFMMLQYVPWPNTLFNDIKKVPPAHYIIMNKNQLEVKRYWNIPFEKNYNINYEEAQSELLRLLDESVNKRMISDVPLGTFLSGGIDSSVITYLARSKVDSLKTYTIGFSDQKEKYDESLLAEQFSQWANVEQTTTICTTDEAFNRIPKLIWHLDEPISETLIYPFNELSKNAKSEFTVALSGEGADEFLYGYRYYSLETFRRMIQLFNTNYNYFAANENPKMRALGYITSANVKSAFGAWTLVFKNSELLQLLENKYNSFDIIDKMETQINSFIPANSKDYDPFMDQHYRLTDYILTSRDKMSMAESLELRVPFLDHELVEFMASLPSDFKISNMQGKKVLRDAFSDLLPNQTIRRRKRPFSAPMSTWLIPFIHKYISDSRLIEDGILNDRIKNYLAFSGNKNIISPNKLWNIVMLEIWYRIFIREEINF